MDWAPWARIALRYVIGGVFMGSDEIGLQLAADPDMVAAAAVAVGAVVEIVYSVAKRFGWAT